MKVSTIQLLAALVVAVTNNGAVVHAVSSSLKRSKSNAAVERKTRSNGGGKGGKGKGKTNQTFPYFSCMSFDECLSLYDSVDKRVLSLLANNRQQVLQSRFILLRVLSNRPHV